MESINLSTAYDLLTDSERTFVESHVREVELECIQRNERIGTALLRPIPGDVVARSRGLLEKPLVLAAIAQRLQEIADDRDLSPKRVIREMMAMAMSNMADFVACNEYGMPMSTIEKANRFQMSGVKKIEVKAGMYGPSLTIQLHDKQASLTQLAQMMGIIDPDSGHWNREKALPADLKKLPATATPQQQEQAYSELLESMKVSP